MKNKIIILVLSVLQTLNLSAQSSADGTSSPQVRTPKDGTSNLPSSTIEEEFAEKLAEKSTLINSISCDFTQTRSLDVLAQNVILQGRFTYMRPGKLLLDFHNGDYIKMGENYFSIKAEGKVSYTKISSNPMLRELKKIIEASMNADIQSMTSGFEISIQKKSGGYAVCLKPQKGRSSGRLQSIKMDFDQEDMSLNTLEIEEGQGEGLKYTFYNKVFNTDVSQIFEE